MSGFLRLRHKTKVISPEATSTQCAKLGARPPTPSAHLQGSPKDRRPQPLYLISFVSWFDRKLTVTLAFLFLLGEAFLSSSAWHAKRESFGQLRTRRRRCWAMVPHPAVQTKAGHLQSARLSGGRQERCFLSFSPSWMHSQSISVAHALQTRALCRGRSSQTCP